MKRSMKASSKKSKPRGFTLLEVMVSVAVLAIGIVPILFLRENSYMKAMNTKAQRIAQQLAQQLISEIALEVRVDEGSGEFEGWSDFHYEYTVTLYDFGSSMGNEDYFGDDGDPYFDKNFNDNVYLDEELQEFGPMMMRHLELIITYPTYVGEDAGEESEYIIDTYIPALMTEEQFERQFREESES